LIAKEGFNSYNVADVVVINLFLICSEILWNTTEETVSSFFLGGATVFVHCYAIFLCSAIYDYQDEKPHEEKGPDDIILKDLMTDCSVIFSLL
jgi:hypothetical protein